MTNSQKAFEKFYKTLNPKLIETYSLTVAHEAYKTAWKDRGKFDEEICDEIYGQYSFLEKAEGAKLCSKRIRKRGGE